MSNETKRGAPVEDGECEVLLKSGSCCVVKKCGQRYIYLNGSVSLVTDADILCHRKHEPLVVPELKKLETFAGKPCVVKHRGEVKFAYQFDNGQFAFIHPDGGSMGRLWWTNDMDTITRAECEAAGYEYPEECP